MLPKGHFLFAAAAIAWTLQICLTTDSNVDFLFVASVAALGLANLAVGALPGFGIRWLVVRFG